MNTAMFLSIRLIYGVIVLSSYGLISSVNGLYPLMRIGVGETKSIMPLFIKMLCTT